MTAAATTTTYTDNDSGVTFDLPASWYETELSKDRDHVDAKFLTTKAEGVSIVYGSTDVWSATPAADKIGYSRRDMNNDIFTKADIAEMLGTNAYSVVTKSYGGVEYFQAKTTQSVNVGGTYLNFNMTQVIRVENGWMYTFQFAGDETSLQFADFVSLLNSVEYPNTTSSAWIFVLVIAIVAGIGIVIFVVAKKKKKTQEISQIDEGKCFCHNCGQELMADSDFCHNCGTKIIRE